MLEELGLPYRVVPVALRGGGQFRPEFLKISPNNLAALHELAQGALADQDPRQAARWLVRCASRRPILAAWWWRSPAIVVTVISLPDSTISNLCRCGIRPVRAFTAHRPFF